MAILNFFQSLGGSMPSVIAQGLIWGVMAIGVYITFRILDIADLTVDGSLATGGAVCVILISSGVNPWLALLCSFLSGLLAGLITGLLHTACGIPAILAGILTQFALYSINLRIMGGFVSTRSNIPLPFNMSSVLSSSNFTLGESTSTIVTSALILLAFIIGIIVLLYWFFGTERGCSLRATGANQSMARAQGINTNTNIVLGLMLSNGLVALCGGMLSQYQNFADINMGRGAIVIGLAAVIVGEVLLSKVFKNFALKLLSVVIGAIIYYLAMTVVLKLGLNTDDLKLFTAIIVALFLALPYFKSKASKRKVGKTAAVAAEGGKTNG